MMVAIPAPSDPIFGKGPIPKIRIGSRTRLKISPVAFNRKGSLEIPAPLKMPENVGFE